MNDRRDEPATKKDLDRVEQKLTGRIDQVEQKLTDKIDTNSKKIDTNSVKIDTNSKKIDNLTIQVINNREEIKKMVTRTEFNERMDEMARGQDKMMTILTRIDQERVATTAWIGRIEGDVEKNKSEIERIKTKLA